MSDTPRTDAAAVSSEFIRREMDHYAHKFVLADHARDLERENAALKAELEESARLHAMGSEREARLIARVAELANQKEIK